MSDLNQAVREYLSKIGSKGGKISSPAKARAVRKNGKRGGRPKGSKNRIDGNQ